MFSGKGAKREQAFLDFLLACWIEIKVTAQTIDFGHALRQFVARTIERGNCLVEPPVGLLRNPFERAGGIAQPVFGTVVTGRLLFSLTKRFQQLLAMHHHLTLLGEFCLLIGFRIDGVKFLDRMADEILVAFCGLSVHFRLFASFGGKPPGVERHRGIRHQILMPGKGIQQSEVRIWKQETLIVELTVHLDQRLADLFEETDADRLIVNERTRAAIGR